VWLASYLRRSSTELIQEHETADKNKERDPEMDVGGNSAE
jgi:hypothetical protein